MCTPPLWPTPTQAIPYEQAKDDRAGGLQVLGEDYVDLLKEGFSNRWIDVYENVGKRSGAYSSGNSRPHPYVLLNHKDNLDCQFTLPTRWATPCTAITAASISRQHQRLCDLRGRGGLHLQRGAADAPPAEKDHR